MSVTIETVPATRGSINGSNSICTGSENSYSVVSVNGATGYTWTLPNGWSGSSGTVSINATSSATGGNISVIAANDCGSSSAQTLSVTVNALPQVSFDFSQNPICSNASPVSLSGLPAGGTFTGQGVSGSTFDPVGLGAGNHVVTYEYSDGNSCSASDTSVVTVTICSGINPVYENVVKVYPNPFNNILTISLTTIFEKGTVVLKDVTGKVVSSFELPAGINSYNLNTTGLSEGIYLLHIIADGKTVAVRKMIRME